ncbi:thiamine-phosphate kinase [Pelagibacterales bacterium SAG-MED15]|nr:thiamine-phosphate kinase [Pelagibacterales bacterium SAG-MED15]
MNEFEIINKYFKKLRKNKSSLNLNDDVFFDKKNKLVLSVDTYVDKIHFFDFKNPELVLRKIIRSSISDIVCKGVNPKFIFICASGNDKHFSKKNLKKIYDSIKEEQSIYNIFIGGGDTVKSSKLTFSITSIGYSSKIVYRNRSVINDDIYVTGNLGDSYTGLCILQNSLKTDKFNSNYFINKYYSPDIQIKLTKKLHEFASSSIDISDGLFADLEKLINKQKYSFKVNLTDVPISNNLINLLKLKKKRKIDFISNGDDYQILFTASKSKQKIINNFSYINKIRITKIGTIFKGKSKSVILDNEGNQLFLKNKGYLHNF